MFHKNIAEDKKGHFKAGVVIAFVVAMAAVVFTDLHTASIIGLSAAFLAGAAKEMSDYRNNYIAAKKGKGPVNSVEFADFWFTCLGGFAIIIILNLF